jgi:hypothetical protein
MKQPRIVPIRANEADQKMISFLMQTQQFRSRSHAIRWSIKQGVKTVKQMDDDELALNICG